MNSADEGNRFVNIHCLVESGKSDKISSLTGESTWAWNFPKAGLSRKIHTWKHFRSISFWSLLASQVKT